MSGERNREYALKGALMEAKYEMDFTFVFYQ
jgi:hypothetical protein